MYKHINFYNFVDGFSGQYEHNFTYEGKRALFDYLEEYEESTGKTIEFDPIALCCDFTEYADIGEFHEDYDAEEYPTMEAIEDHKTVIRIPNKEGFIILVL